MVCRHHQGGRRAEVVTDSEGRFEFVAPRAPGTPCVMYLVGSDFVMAQEKDQSQYGSWDARFRVYHEFVVGEEAAECRCGVYRSHERNCATAASQAPSMQ